MSSALAVAGPDIRPATNTIAETRRTDRLTAPRKLLIPDFMAFSLTDISDLTIIGQPHETPTSLRSGCRRDRAVVTTFGRAGIRPAARPRRLFSDTSPALRPFFAQPYTSRGRRGGQGRDDVRFSERVSERPSIGAETVAIVTENAG